MAPRSRRDFMANIILGIGTVLGFGSLAYRFLEYGVAKGVVKTISENSFTVDDNNQPVNPYFKVHVAITEVNLRGVPKRFRLLPGDTLTGDVMVGKRTIMSYLLDGIRRTTSEAMREP